MMSIIFHFQDLLCVKVLIHNTFNDYTKVGLTQLLSQHLTISLSVALVLKLCARPYYKKK